MRDVAGLVAVAALVAGCGGGISTSGASPTSTSPTSPSSPTSPTTPPAASPLPAGRSGVAFTNARGETVVGTAFVPVAAGPFPAVIVLHGSGGLFDEPADAGGPQDDPATAELERQFEEWADLLVGEGYAVLMPASFYSRGFFDWNKEAPEGLTTEERLIFRVFDAFAAIDFLATRSNVDAANMAVLGLSNGGSTVLLSLHDGVEDLPEFAALGDRAGAPDVRLGVAYYPGCGLHGLVPISDGDYFPRVERLLLLHAEQDPLTAHLATREAQAQAEADSRGVANPLDVHVFLGDVGHGFDSSPDTPEEDTARTTGRAMTLDALVALKTP